MYYFANPFINILLGTVEVNLKDQRTTPTNFPEHNDEGCWFTHIIPVLADEDHNQGIGI